MNGIPQFPANISPNGKEIWDWAAQLGDEMQRRDAIADLTKRIANLGRFCGDCEKWMKTSQCPRERNVGGYSRGPSMSAPKCGQFVEKTSTTEFREQLKSELAELQK